MSDKQQQPNPQLRTPLFDINFYNIYRKRADNNNRNKKLKQQSDIIIGSLHPNRLIK